MLAPTLISLIGFVLWVLLATLAYAAWVVHKLTWQKRVPVHGHPTEWDLQWEDAAFTSRGDNVTLSGWYLPSSADDRCIILIQGTHHHRNSPGIKALQLGRDLVGCGFSVLLFDSRGRGESAGQRSSGGDREQWDTFGAIDYVTGRGIPVERIGLLGFSLGAGVAILVAAQEPRIPAVVSDSGFLDYMRDLRRLTLGPVPLPDGFAHVVAWVGRLCFKADFSNVRPAEVVGAMDQPIFFIHGEDDSVISVDESVKLHALSENQEDRVWMVPGAKHVRIYAKMPDMYAHRVSQFFHRHIP